MDFIAEAISVNNRNITLINGVVGLTVKPPNSSFH